MPHSRRADNSAPSPQARTVRAAPIDGGISWPREPMLAKTVDHLPVPGELTGGALYDVKFDGFRGLIGVDGAGRVQIRSRQGNDLTRAFPDVAAAAATQLKPGTLLDGELVVWDGDRLSFAELQARLGSPARAAARARRHPASYVAFDVLQLAGRHLGTEALRVRRRRLEALLVDLAPPLQITPATRDRDVAAGWFADYAAADVGIEGLIIKGLAAQYKPGQRAWLKLRSRLSTEAIVGAVTGSLVRPERLILGLPHPDGALRFAGTTNVLALAQQRELAPLLRAAGEQHPWLDDTSGALARTWSTGRGPGPLVRVEPSLVVEVDTDASTTAGRFRHTVRLIRPRPDLDAGDVQALNRAPI